MLHKTPTWRSPCYMPEKWSKVLFRFQITGQKRPCRRSHSMQATAVFTVLYTAVALRIQRVWGNRLEADILGAELDELSLSISRPLSLLNINTKNTISQYNISKPRSRKTKWFQVPQKCCDFPWHFPRLLSVLRLCVKYVFCVTLKYTGSPLPLKKKKQYNAKTIHIFTIISLGVF